MGKILITAGNVFNPTFDGVCYAAKKTFENVAAIHIFDTQESESHAEKTQRISRIRSILGFIDIAIYLVDDDNLQIIIPDRMSKLIDKYGRDNLIVDLSNGQKITASVLYATATISRISHIYALNFFIRIDRETNIQDLNSPDEWCYTKIEPLKEILEITKSSQIELIYYRDRIEMIVAKLTEKNLSFGDNTKDRLEHSLLDYFTSSTAKGYSTERLARCINGLGKICEDTAAIWHNYCHQTGLITKPATDFNARVKQIIKCWDEYRKKESKGVLDQTDPRVTNSIIPTLPIDVLLETMRVYRNLASHSHRHYLFSKEDARLALDTTLLILEKLSDSKILIHIGEQDE